MATNLNITQITPPRVPLTDERTGAVSREWYRWFYNIYNITGGPLGITPVANGGTGLNTIPTNGQLLIGDGTGYTLNTLAVGSGISVTNGLGTITLANTGVLSNIAGTGISVSGATGNVTIDNLGVLSFSGGTTGLTPAATTAGAITLAGTLGIANGGTNGSAAPTAYGVAYGTGTAYAFTAAGTAKQVLIANSSAAPTWSTLTSGTSILYGDGSGGFSNVTIGTGVSFVAGTLSATGSGGTVTSVSFTGGIITVATASTTPALTVAGTSGGIPYFSSGTTWATSAALTQYGIVYGGGAGAAPVSTAAGTTGQVLTATTSGAPTWSSTYAGTVTSVAQSFTGGLISVAGSPITTSGTLALTVAGTSGGIPYFASGTTWASSAALALNAIVLGGGAGAAPATTTTGTGVVTALGINTGTAGAFVVNGGALGTPSSGTVTNLTGTASININGTVGATTPAAGTFTSLSDSGDLAFTGTSNRVTGLMNGTVLSRLAFQTSTANAATGLYILPNGTGTVAELRVSASSDPTNASTGALSIVSGTDVRVQSFISGTGTYLPLTFYTSGAEKVRIDTAGNVGIGTSSPNASAILDAQSTTKGVRFPNMTTTQKNAIATPPAGLVIFDTTLSKLCVYSGAAWQTITSI